MNKPPQIICLLLVPLILLVIYYLRIPLSNQVLASPHYNFSHLDKTDIQDTPPPLIDVTLQAGIQQAHIQRNKQLSGLHESMGAGACAFDADNDGWVDLLLLNGSGTTHFFGKTQWWQANKNSFTLYKNNRDGTFTDNTLSSQLQSSLWTMGCASGDIDNDGDNDIFISAYGENQLWINNGDGSFRDITQAASIHGDHWSTSVSFIDVNRDGWLDIYVNNFIAFTPNSLTFEETSGYETHIPKSFNAALYHGQSNQLWINQGINKGGQLQFIDQAKAMGVDNSQGRSLSSLWLDINDDGYQDIFIANGKNSANKVLLNQQGQSFIDISSQSGIGFVDKSSGITAFDSNQNLQIELFVSTDNTLYPKLYRPTTNRSSAFRDESDSYELATATSVNLSHWGSLAQDINLDGWLDIVIANGLSTPNQNAPLIARGQTNTLLINQQGQSLINHSAQLGPNTHPAFSSRCALSADFDNNGSPDIFISNNNDLGQLLSNQVKPLHWLGVILRGSPKQTAVGAKLSLTITDKIDPKNNITLVRYFGDQQHFLCNSDQRVIFGLGKLMDNQKTLNLSIDWPNGEQQHFTDLPKNHYLIFSQAATTYQPFIPKKPVPVATLRLNEAKHQLIVIPWLIHQKHYTQAKQVLRSLIQHSEENIRLQALTLSQQLPSPERNGFIQIAMNDDAVALRLGAIDLIKHNEDELFARWLLKQLDHHNNNVVCAASRTFSHFFDEEEAFIVHQYTALNRLIQLASQGNKHKQLCAIAALGKSEHFRALHPLMELLNDHDHDQEIRLTAIQALGYLKEKTVLPVLSKIVLNNNEDNAIRAAALIASKQIDRNFSVKLAIDTILENDKQTTLPLLNYAYFHAENRLIIQPDIKPFLSLLPKKSLTHTLNSKSKPSSTIPSRCQQTLRQKNSTLDTIKACLSHNTFYKNMPPGLSAALKSKATRSIWLEQIAPLIASRKERWARELSLSIVNDKHVSLSTQQSLLAHLPKPLPIGTLQQLTRLYSQNPNAKVAPYIAKVIVTSDNTILIEQLLAQLSNHLNNNNGNAVLATADALIAVAPERVLTLLTNNESSN